MRFEIHIYFASMEHQTMFSNSIEDAKDIADKYFKKSQVYKVKVWDLTKGDIEPNRVNPVALVYHLV